MALVAPDPSQWRIQQAIIMRRADQDILAILREAQRQNMAMIRRIANTPGIGATIRRQQLQLIRQQLKLAMADTWRNIGDKTRARRHQAAARVINLNAAQDAFLLVSAGVPGGAAIASAIAQAEIDAAKSSIDRMMARASGASHVDLSERVYNSNVSLNSQIDTQVNSALARGLSAREFAREVSGFINPNTPGGIRYAAMRLSRTEINNAAHAVAINAVQDKPWVDQMKWRLSGSHPRPDICNQYASGGVAGDGMYSKGSVPAKPHPHCFCYVTPEPVDEEQFMDSLFGGKYNAYLERYSPGISNRFVENKGFVR